MIARTAVGGYVPGQTINFELDVSNKSDQAISKFTVQLIKVSVRVFTKKCIAFTMIILLKQITYREYPNSIRHKDETIVITEEEACGCDINQDQVIKVNIKVPSVPPNISTSNIIKVRYYCRVRNGIAEMKANLFQAIYIRFSFSGNRLSSCFPY